MAISTPRWITSTLGPGTWSDFFHKFPPNVDHVQYWQYEDEARLDPRLAVSVCADAWALVWRLQLVETGRP